MLSVDINYHRPFDNACKTLTLVRGLKISGEIKLCNEVIHTQVVQSYKGKHQARFTCTVHVAACSQCIQLVVCIGLH